MFIWPKVSESFINNSAIKSYRVIDLLSSGKAYRRRNNSIFDLLDPVSVIDWCREEAALVIVARSINMFTSNEDKKIMNPLMLALLSVYGQNQPFLNEIRASFSSGTWVGSLVPYLEADKVVIKQLKDHDDINVKTWASNFVDYIDNKIEYETKQNAEENMLRG
jgi:hypothetical protein